MEPHQRSAQFSIPSGLVPDRTGTDLSVSDSGTVVSGLTFLSAATPLPGSRQFAPSVPRPPGRGRNAAGGNAGGNAAPAPPRYNFGGMAAIAEDGDDEGDAGHYHGQGGGEGQRHGAPRNHGSGNGQPQFSGRQSRHQQAPEVRPLGGSYLGEQPSHATGQRSSVTGQRSRTEQQSHAEQRSHAGQESRPSFSAPEIRPLDESGYSEHQSYATGQQSQAGHQSHAGQSAGQSGGFVRQSVRAPEIRPLGESYYTEQQSHAGQSAGQMSDLFRRSVASEGSRDAPSVQPSVQSFRPAQINKPGGTGPRQVPPVRQQEPRRQSDRRRQPQQHTHHDSRSVTTDPSLTRSALSRSTAASSLRSSTVSQVSISNFDNTRYLMHNPITSTAEVDVTRYQDAIEGGDEVTPLPEEYLRDSDGNRIHERAEEAPVEYSPPPVNRVEVEVLPAGSTVDDRKSPFSRGRVRYSLSTVAAAVALAVVGLWSSVRSLGTNPVVSRCSLLLDGVGGADSSASSRFGGGLGGLVSGNLDGCELELELMGRRGGTREFGALPSPAAAASPAAPRASILPRQGTRGVVRPQLSAAPLASYAPPPDDAADALLASTLATTPEVRAYADLADLPYDQLREVPVVMHAPLSGGSAVRAVFGRCLRLVQCTEAGREVLVREYEEEHGGTRAAASAGVADVGRRGLMHLEPVDSDGRPLLDEPDDVAPDGSFDPPLRTEVVYTSEYVNVDCTSPGGIDRAIRHDLLGSNTADVLYTGDVYDASRLMTGPPGGTDPGRRGRLVGVFRNPVERAVAMYRYLRYVNDDVKAMTLEEFAASCELRIILLSCLFWPPSWIFFLFFFSP